MKYTPKDAIKQKLMAGENVFGTCVTVNAPRWPEIVAGAGLDFVFLDTEHIAIDRSELSSMCRQYNALGLSPIVRIPAPDPNRASQAIDDGATGVIAPYLEHVGQIKDLAGAVKYRPLKGEKLRAYMNGEEQMPEALHTYLNQFNFGKLCIANIESMPAVEKLDELLTIEGLDAVFIGPHDLSISMGIPEQYDHPRFIKTVKMIVQKARAHTLGVGIHFSLEPQRQVDWMKEGVNIVIHSSDMALFSQKLRGDMAFLRSGMPAHPSADSADDSVTI